MLIYRKWDKSGHLLLRSPFETTAQHAQKGGVFRMTGGITIVERSSITDASSFQVSSISVGSYVSVVPCKEAFRFSDGAINAHCN